LSAELGRWPLYNDWRGNNPTHKKTGKNISWNDTGVCFRGYARGGFFEFDSRID
jgi:hypothetical protein